MSAKVGFVVVLGVAASLAAVAALWQFKSDKWSSPYREVNATWIIQGLCTNAQNGAPIKGAQIMATFREPIAFGQHWRSPPALATTNVVAKTDTEGRFEVSGEGGSVYIKAHADGFREPEPWENWSCSARNGTDRVETNITLSLSPALKRSRDEAAPQQ